MNTLDWLVLAVFFIITIAVGVISYFKTSDSNDFFVAGGKLPFWLLGISHHVSGYSGAVFVAYAALAYTHGLSIYVWWAFTVGISIIFGAFFIPKLWVNLRIREKIQSPLEFLAKRYNLPTQQIIAWSGVILKLFDMAAKWVAIAIILNVFTGLPLIVGIFLTGGVSILYISLGGFLAVVLTDFFQFIVQVIAGVSMFVIVVIKLGGTSSIFGIWEQLPPQNSQLFNSPYTVFFALAFLLINFFSYSGGTWNLATRYISAQNPKEAKKSSILSGILYLVWPLILFFPMWASPILFPNIENPETVYGVLTLNLLPHGLIGLILASMFANTMSMTSSDANTIAAVINRDILPNLSVKFRNLGNKKSLFNARITTSIFIFATIILALFSDHFGGVLGLLINWFAAFLGITSVPVILGLLPYFKNCTNRGAIFSMIIGFSTFVITKFLITKELTELHPNLIALEIGSPILITLIVYLIFSINFKSRKQNGVTD